MLNGGIIQLDNEQALRWLREMLEGQSIVRAEALCALFPCER